MTPEDFLRARVAEDERIASTSPSREQAQRCGRNVRALRAVLDLYDASEFCERHALHQTVAVLCALYDFHPDYRLEWAQ